MPRGLTTFRQRDVAAAIKAARHAGLEVARVEIDKTGKIVIVSSIGVPPPLPEPELDEWEARIRENLLKEKA
jgi:hypothetical protein